MKRKMKKTTHTRIYEDTLKKLKVEAAREGKSVLDLLEEKLSQK